MKYGIIILNMEYRHICIYSAICPFTLIHHAYDFIYGEHVKNNVLKINTS